MKKPSTLFLKAVLLLGSVTVLAGLIYFPQTEGRAANLDLISIYSDPLIMYVYLSSIPFFYGIFQAMNLLNLIDMNKAFTQSAVNTLRNMKLASIAMIALVAGAELFLHFVAKGDDLAGPTMLGLCVCLTFAVIATATSIFQKLFQNAVDLQSENDLTV